MERWIPRKKIMRDILSAIEAADGSTHVFYITGAGGIGKTTLLRQVGMQLGSSDGIDPSFPWSGIQDLYHSDVNTNSGLEAGLSHTMGKAGEFEKYWAKRDAYTARREAGETGLELEQERAKLSDEFVSCMNRVTSKNRAVIALDTTERIQYEVDSTQRLCQLESESTSVKGWLLDQLQRWQNCVVLLAGRPDKEFRAALAKKYTGSLKVRYHSVDLGGFDEGETLEYFALQKEEHPVVGEFDTDFKKKLGKATEGKPIRLDLAIYIAEHELGLDEFRRLLEEAQPEQPEQAQERMDQMLVQHVMQNEPDNSIRTILRYLAVARKGLDASLLHHLAGEWPIDECQKRLNEISDRSYIKQRPEDGRLFLHDAMYQFCDDYMLSDPEVQELSRILVNWYDERIEASTDEKEQQNYQVDSVLYRLRAEPCAGYHWYAKLVDEAIRYAEVGFDMRLRSELRAFLESPSPIDQQLISRTPGLQKEIDCDCAARWVKRFLSRGDNDKAVRVGEAVSREPEKFCQSDLPSSRLAQADLDVYYAQALIYTNKTDEGIALLKQRIAELEGREKPEDVARQGDPHEFAGWRRNLVLGRAHNNLGYAYWLERGQLHLALQELRTAVPYFRASDLHEEYANTCDNMGRVYALLFEQSRAESMLEDGLELRQKLKRDYRIALALNSRAIAHLAFDEPHRAQQRAEESLNITERLGIQRGVGLACLTLGRSLRKLCALDLYPPHVRNNFFKESASNLKGAVEIFEKRVHEPVRLIEAYNELGCTYRDWAAMAANEDEKSSLAKSLSPDTIDNLTTSIELAEARYPTWYVDCCEDLAQVHYQRGDQEHAEMWLQRAENKIPDDYKLQAGRGLPSVPADKLVEEFFQLLGKIELLRGYMHYKFGRRSDEGQVLLEDLEQAVHHFAIAATYFTLYSEREKGLEKTHKQLYTRFKKCKHEDLKHLQEVVIPEIASTYGLDQTLLTGFFGDILGLALQ